MSKYCHGKIAVITGAGSGIGRALAQQLNQRDCRLYLSDIDGDALEDTRQSLGNTHVGIDLQVLDVADRTAVYDWADRVGETTGGVVDVMINNAGVGLVARADEMQYEDFEWLMGINFWGVVYGSAAFLPLLKAAPRSHLVNISSVFGLISVPTQAAYNASKFAVRGYTEALRQELKGSKVHACCVHPGGIRTNIAASSRATPGTSTADERAAAFAKVARTSPHRAANRIIKAIDRRKKRLLIGSDARYISLVSRLFPVHYPGLLPGLGRVGQEEPR